MRRPVTFVLSLVALCSAGLSSEPAKDELVERTMAYVERFLDGYANVIAEEHYTQEATVKPRRRSLRSDLVVVRYPGSAEWHVFRDVFEVDGQLIRDWRQERLLNLFVAPPESALPRAQELTNASARYNVREIGTVNNPLMTLTFLQPRYRERFRFIVGGHDRKVGPTIRTIRFEEFRASTILKQGGNLDLPARGVIWADESTGRIAKTELRLGAHGLHQHGTLTWLPPTTVTTTFGKDEVLEVDVPLEMADKYPLYKVDVKGTAKYSRFRRFEPGRPPVKAVQRRQLYKIA